jgi:RNA polymerase sigma factor (sigma-70 family)
MRGEASRLRSFIRRRVADPRDADDILQDVFYALVEANRLLMPIDHLTGWLFRVARNRIVDLFRTRTPEFLELQDLLPSPEAGPEAEYARSVLLDALERAIAELPREQRDAFVGHELEGRSFKEMAATSGVSVNTLLSRKRYAVLRLRERLRRTYDDVTKS